MSPTWAKAAAMLLCVAVPTAALAETEETGHKKRWKPKSSIMNVFGGNSRTDENPVRLSEPEPSVSGGDQPGPSSRLVPLQTTQGNLTYVPEKLEPLRDLKIKEPRPADALAAAIFDALQSETPDAAVLPAERKAIIGHYQDNGFKPLWTTSAGISDRARAVIALLQDAASEGLDPADYSLHVLGGFDAQAETFANDLPHLARLDIELTARAMAYARHASGGRLVPDRLSTYNDIDAPRIMPEAAMHLLVNSPFAAEWLKSLHPTHPAYAMFRMELAALRQSVANGMDETIPPGKRVKLGQQDDRIPILQKRMVKLGFQQERKTPDFSGLPPHILASAVAADSAASRTFSKDLSEALKEFQKKHNLKATGALDQPTVRMLNDQSGEKNLSRLLANIERLRWLPRELGNRHIFVNQAAFKLWVRDGGSTVWETNVVVGKADSQTYAFHDTMETVVFNPSWGVPPSILSNEMLPILWRDPSYLDRKGFTVVDRKGKKVASSSVNWAAYGSNAPFSIMQPPGEDNALGEVKFLFPNSHHIYMHDTPTRQLFSRPVRAFSHGCVRVENPRRFAEIILGMSAQEVAKRIDSGRSQGARVKDKLPVHLTYFTAWPGEGGTIEYFPDIYGRDVAIESAFNKRQVALR
jgi:murein L,D-transpeptidase YcbB/YkuD